MQAMLANYWNRIPENSAHEIIFSGAFATALSAVIGVDKEYSLLAGMLSASATAISSVVTPLFRGEAMQIRSRTDEIIGECGRTSLGIIGTGLMSAVMGRFPNVPVDTATCALYVGLAIARLKGGDLSEANGILIVPVPTLAQIKAIRLY